MGAICQRPRQGETQRRWRGLKGRTEDEKHGRGGGRDSIRKIGRRWQYTLCASEHAQGNIAFVLNSEHMWACGERLLHWNEYNSFENCAHGKHINS